MDRVILHSDMNACYANIELLHHPELQGKPLAVAGSTEDRRGIVLSKDDIAKKAGVKTGMTIWNAMRICPELNVLEPRMELYIRFSRMIREIYAEYTDRQEAFGIDESWLDLSGCAAIASGAAAADEIRRRVKSELGVTVSIGVSWNKIFAKLGSDYKKPDAVTVINRDSFKDIVWPLPVEDLLYVGPATSGRLRGIGIRTIGELASADADMLNLRLGKMGFTLHAFANGRDISPVTREDYTSPVKSIGNSTTTPRDMENEEDVFVTLSALAESVGKRLRESGFMGQGLEFSARSTDLSWCSCQKKLNRPTDITPELRSVGMELFRQLSPALPLRSIGLRCYDLVSASSPEQTDIFGEISRRDSMRAIDAAVDDIRRRYGYGFIQRGTALKDARMGMLNAREEHIVHPVGYFGR